MRCSYVYFSSLIGFLWDAAPFLGLSTLALALLAREQHQALPRKAWRFGLLITIILGLDLAAMVAEIRAILDNAPQIDVNTFFIAMHFWPAFPIAAISALSIAILAMVAALVVERRTAKALVSIPLASLQVEEKAGQSEIRLDLDGMSATSEFEVEITSL